MDVLIVDESRDIEDVIFFIDAELGIYSTYHRIDIFLKNNGIRNNKDYVGSLLHFADFPDGVERSIENLKPILQKLFDDFLLDYSFKMDLGKEVFHPLVSRICGDV